jgi:hypothetical protein
MFAARFHRRPLALAVSLSIPMLAAAVSSQAVAQDAGRTTDLSDRRADIESRYIFGPSAAREIGYRITWQTSFLNPITRFEVFAGDVYASDDKNMMTRVDRSTGDQIWTVMASDRHDRIRGITPGMTPYNGLPWGENNDDKLYVTTDTVVFVIDHATGSVVGRQKLAKLPSTDAVRFGPYLVYGTRSGQIVWHQYLVGYEWRANQLMGPVVATPTMLGTDRITAASLGGTVIALDAKTAGRVWDTEVFEDVTASTTTGGGYVFVASEDQYLWAFDARSGRTAWRYFTESKLLTPPIHAVATVDGGSRSLVLQWVETEGLVCLDANPGDTVEGKVLWKIEGARGLSIGQAGERLFLWDAEARVLRIVNLAQGAVTRVVELPQVTVCRMVGDSIFASGDDGRLTRLDPMD